MSFTFKERKTFEGFINSSKSFITLILWFSQIGGFLQDYIVIYSLIPIKMLKSHIYLYYETY